MDTPDETGIRNESERQTYEKPEMTEHEPLEEATAYVYYYRVF